MISLNDVRRAVHDVRDELTEDATVEPICPLALDVVFSSPLILERLTAALNRKPTP